MRFCESCGRRPVHVPGDRCCEVCKKLLRHAPTLPRPRLESKGR